MTKKHEGNAPQEALTGPEALRAIQEELAEISEANAPLYTLDAAQVNAVVQAAIKKVACVEEPHPPL